MLKLAHPCQSNFNKIESRSAKTEVNLIPYPTMVSTATSPTPPPNLFAPIPSTPLLNISREVGPPSWIDNFRRVQSQCNDPDRHQVKFWFWDHFDWSRQSLWIGKFHKTNNLPQTNVLISNFMSKLLTDLNTHPEIRSHVYIKFYFSRNIKTKEPNLDFLMLCDSPNLPESFSDTFVDVVFEKYQLTEAIVNKESNFRKLIDHYINWNNFYSYYDLMGECQF